MASITTESQQIFLNNENAIVISNLLANKYVCSQFILR